MKIKNLTTKQAATLSGCTTSAVRAAIARGALVATRVGRDWQVAPADLYAWQEERRRGRPGRKKKHPHDFYGSAGQC